MNWDAVAHETMCTHPRSEAVECCAAAGRISNLGRCIAVAASYVEIEKRAYEAAQRVYDKRGTIPWKWRRA